MAETFTDKLQQAIQNLITLDIVTIVGTVDLNVTRIDDMKGDAIRTRLDLLTGDVVTQFDPKFVDGGPYASLRSFHAQREQQGHDIIDRNIALIKSLFELADSHLQDRQNSSTTETE